MDPLSILSTALGLANAAFSIGKQFWGTPDWEKYVEAGILVAQKAIPIVQDAIANPDKYGNLTPTEIQTLLKPATWEELEALAKIQELAE